MGELANALTRRSGTGTLKPTVKAKAPASAESEIIPLKVKGQKERTKKS